MISNSGHDERGSYTGGAAGDQTGKEWEIRSWYNRPWDCVLRYPDMKVGALIAELAIEAANNDYIGYDQGNRDTFWAALQKAKYRPANITIKCEADCSAGVIAITKAAGYLLDLAKLKKLAATYTGDMKDGYKAAGFSVLTAKKYLTNDDYLLPGDILLNEGHHTATNITVGKYAKAAISSVKNEKTVDQLTTEVINGDWGNDPARALAAETRSAAPRLDYAGEKDNAVSGPHTFKTTTNLRLRAGAGTNKAILATLTAGASVVWYGYFTTVNGTRWLFVETSAGTGFVSSKYLREA